MAAMIRGLSTFYMLSMPMITVDYHHTVQVAHVPVFRLSELYNVLI